MYHFTAEKALFKSPNFADFIFLNWGLSAIQYLVDFQINFETIWVEGC